MLKIYKNHHDYIGKICKPSPLAVILEEKYVELFKIGNVDIIKRLFESCNDNGEFGSKLIFIDVDSFSLSNETWFCVEEIGKNSNGDWFWLTLNQLIVCE